MNDTRGSIILIIPFFIVLSAGQVLRSPSVYENGIKWEFGSNVFHGDVSARSNVGQVPVVSQALVHKKQLVVPAVRKEPVVATVYKTASVVPDIHQNPTTYRKEPVAQNVRKHWPVMPTVVKAQSWTSNVHKNEPVAWNAHNQQAVPFVQKTYPVSSVYKSQPIGPYVHHQDQPLHQFVVPKVLPVDSQQKIKTEHHPWSHRYNPRHFTRENVQVVSHN